MTKKTQAETFAEVLKTSLAPIVERLDKLGNTINKPITSQVDGLNETKPVSEEPKASIPSAVPSDWLTEVYATLNKEFAVEIEPHRDAPLTTLTIVVPEKYSQMTPSQKEILKRDIRPKVITNAGGSHEVREWAETVYKNLTPEVQAMVVSDRRTV